MGGTAALPEEEAFLATPVAAPAAMPLMALASTAVDQIAKERDQAEKNILAYAMTDTCRFVADAAREPEVRRRQDKYHEPILAWLHEKHGADLTRGAPGMLRAPPTPPEALDALTTACALTFFLPLLPSILGMLPHKLERAFIANLRKHEFLYKAYLWGAW